MSSVLKQKINSHSFGSFYKVVTSVGLSKRCLFCTVPESEQLKDKFFLQNFVEMCYKQV